MGFILLLLIIKKSSAAKLIMCDFTESKVISTESEGVISEDMKILEQGPSDSGDTAWTSTAPPRKVVKKINEKDKEADMSSKSLMITDEEKKLQEESADKEPMEVDAEPNPEPVVLPDYEEEFEGEDVLTALRSGQTTFMLVKLPDNVPASGAEKKPESKSFLKDLEGQMAKMFVLRTGQIRLLIGNSIFEVRTGTKSSLQHELIAIVHDDETNTDNLVVVMGSVQHKITIVPDWETLSKELGLK